MIHYTCVECRANNTEKRKSVSACAVCGAIHFLDGDAQIAEQEWIVERFDLKVGWRNVLLAPVVPPCEFAPVRPKSFLTITDAMDRILKEDSPQKLENHRIVNLRTGRTVGPLDFSLVENYTPDMDPDPVPEPVAAKPARPKRKKRQQLITH